jgi:hypothetical protein
MSTPPSGSGHTDHTSVASFEAALERFLVTGPDPVDPEEDPSFLETLLPWPVRLMTVVGVWVLARYWRDTAIAEQLSWGLAYSGTIAVSIAASFAGVILASNAVLGSLWWFLARFTVPRREERPVAWFFWQAVEFLNPHRGLLDLGRPRAQLEAEHRLRASFARDRDPAWTARHQRVGPAPPSKGKR